MIVDNVIIIYMNCCPKHQHFRYASIRYFRYASIRYFRYASNIRSGQSAHVLMRLVIYNLHYPYRSEENRDNAGLQRALTYLCMSCLYLEKC